MDSPADLSADAGGNRCAPAADFAVCRRLCDSLQLAFGLVEVVADGAGRPCDLRFLEVNTAFGQLAGFSPDAVIGRTSRQINPAMPPFALEELGRVVCGGERVHFEKFDRAWGKWLEVRGFSLGEGRFAILLNDVTGRRWPEEELKAARERLRLILDHAPAGVCVAEGGPGGVISYLNPRALAIAGYELSDIPTLKAWNEKAFPDPAYRAEVAESILRDVADGYRTRDGVYRMSCRDGAVKEVQLRVAELPGGTIVHFVSDVSGQLRDQAALHRLTATLEQQVAEHTRVAEERTRELQVLALQLVEAEERERHRIGEFLHDDLQQLLVAARYKLQLLQQDGAVNDTLRPLVRKIDEIIDEAIRKTRWLSHEISPPILHLEGLGRALEWLAGQVEEEHGLAVRFQARQPVVVENGYLRAYLYRAVRELIFNAVKHAGVGEVEVSLDRAGDRLEIVVADRGRGFDPAALQAGGGAAGGLGLAGIGERAGFFGGELRVESAPGRGSRFVLTVPLSAGPPEPRAG